MRKYVKHWAGAAIAVIVLFPYQNSAAAQDGPERAASGRSSMLEEVVVTAQKRQENLSDVPISIQAFSPDALASRGIESQLDLSLAVPSLNVGSQAGYATIFLRGIGTEAFLTADPSIASYVDGVYFPFSPTFIQDFAGVERVEVLKGPQGTLFGRNATGGAISVTNKAPDFVEPYIDIDVTYGNFGLFKPRIYANVPVSQDFAIDLSAYRSEQEYYLDGTSAGKPLRDEISRGLRVKARWAPLDWAELNLAFTRTRNQGNGAIGQNLNPSPLGRQSGIEPPEDRREVNVDERLYGVADTRVVSGQLNFYAPWLDIKLLASDQLNSLLYNYDFDGSTEPLVSFNVPGHPADIQQSEIQLISNEGHPWSSWLDVTAGAFFFENIQGFDPVEITVGNNSALNESRQAFVDSLAESPLNLDVGDLAGTQRLYRARAEAQVATKSKGYYLQFTAALTDWFSLTLGGRYQDEERGLHKSNVTFVLGDTEAPNRVDWTEFDARDKDDNPRPINDTTKGFYPKVTLDFRPFDDDTLVFLSWQKAEKAHAYNAFAVYLPAQYIYPERITAAELGIKTSFFDGLTRLSAAYFEYDIDDLQTQYVSLFTGGALAFENAPEANSKGADLDLITELFPSKFNGLALSLNVGYVDAKFGSYPDAAGYDEETGVFSNDNDFSGNRQTRTPQWSGSVALTKFWVLGNSELEVGANYYYNDGFFYSASNDPNYEQEQYSLYGAFAKYSYLPWRMSARFYGRNLKDEFYTQGVISTDFGGVFTVAQGRSYGLTLSWEM